MAAQNIRNTKDLSQSGTEALQALVNSLSPEILGTSKSDDKLTPEQVKKLSDRLNELVGGGEPDELARNINEKGEMVNDEGLPIIEISEQVSDPDSVPSTEAPITIEEPDLIPLNSTSDAERQRLRIERDRILDVLEEEERREQRQGTKGLTKDQIHDLLQKRKGAAKIEAEKLNKAKALQKKMGKALLQGMAEEREKEGEKVQEQATAPKVKKKEGKSVSFADLPSDAGKKVDREDASSRTHHKIGSIPLVKAKGGQLPMKMQVVERFPAPSSAAKQVNPNNTDKKSNPDSFTAVGAARADTKNIIRQDDQPSQDTNERSYNDSDIDSDYQHEIATEYYKKRDMIGENASKVMASHIRRDAADAWNQSEVPLDATLSSLPPKPAISRFKSDRLTYDHNIVASNLSAIPAISSQTLKRTVRVGRLEGDRLVGSANDSESGSENENETIRKSLEMLKNNDPCVAQMDSEDQSQHPDQSAAISSFPAVKEALPIIPKVSKFMSPLAESRPTTTVTVTQTTTTPASQAEKSSPKHFRRTDVVSHQVPAQSERMSLSVGPMSQQSSFTSKLPGSRAGATGFISESSAQVPMIVDSPSFANPKIKNTGRPDRPLTVMSPTVRESGETKDKDGLPSGHATPSPRRISRFMAERS